MHLDFGKNYFELFDLPLGFELDKEALSQRFRTMQSRFHPDRYAAAGDQERRLSVQSASLINEAFDTLKDPLKRARYLLTLKGVAFNDERETSSDPVFLMQQIELREALDKVRGHDEPWDELERVAQQIRQSEAALLRSFEASYREDDLVQAKDAVLKIRFYVRLLEEVVRLEEHLESEAD